MSDLETKTETCPSPLLYHWYSVKIQSINVSHIAAYLKILVRGMCFHVMPFTKIIGFVSKNMNK